jgi:hypothetical protein
MANKHFELVDFKPKEEKTPWVSQELFVKKLKRLERNLEKQKKYEIYDSSKPCIICLLPDINNKLYHLKNFYWEDGLKHLIEKHNVRPSIDFVDHILSHYIGITKNNTVRLPSLIHTNNKDSFIKLDRNQLMIMDALYESGGGTKKYLDRHDSKNRSNQHNSDHFRFSEHAGLLQLNKNNVENIIVFGNTNRIDPYDNEIYLPKNVDYAYDFEYIFHTHPATPSPGARMKDGILYEFPSVSDIIHFMEHTTLGRTKGSIVIAPEGCYVIKKNKDTNMREIDLSDFRENMREKVLDIQKHAIKKYGTKVAKNQNFFHKKVAIDKSYLKKYNHYLNRYGIQILYQPRIRDSKGRWVLDTLYIKEN